MIETKLPQSPAKIDKVLPFFDRSLIMLCRMWANNTYHNEMAKNLIASLPKRIKKDTKYNDLNYRNHDIKIGDALIYNNGNSSNYILFVKNILQCDVRLYNTSNKAFNLSNIAVAHLHIGFYENDKFSIYNFGLLELKILVQYLNYFLKMPMFHALFAESCLNILHNTKGNVSLQHQPINGLSHSNFKKGDILKTCGEFDGTLWKVLEAKKSGNLLVSAISGNLHFTEQLSKEYAEYFEHAKLQHLELVASK